MMQFVKIRFPVLASAAALFAYGAWKTYRSGSLHRIIASYKQRRRISVGDVSKEELVHIRNGYRDEYE